MINSPVNVHWELTNKCNLNCQHCYQLDDEADRYLPTSDRDMLIAQRIVECGVFEVTLTGGEIFMVKHIFELIDLFNKADIEPHVTTNGTLIDASIAKELSSRRVTVQVSLDSHDAAVHDQIRGRTGAFDGALRGITYLIKEGVNVSLAFTSMEANGSDGPALIRLALELGVPKVCVGVVLPYFGPHTLLLDRRSVADVASQNSMLQNEAIKAAGMGVDVQLSNQRPGVSCRSCSALTRDMAILHDGTAYPCPFVRGPKYALGSVIDKPIDELWRSQASDQFRADTAARATPVCVTGADGKQVCRPKKSFVSVADLRRVENNSKDGSFDERSDS